MHIIYQQLRRIGQGSPEGGDDSGGWLWPLNPKIGYDYWRNFWPLQVVMNINSFVVATLYIQYIYMQIHVIAVVTIAIIFVKFSKSYFSIIVIHI